MDNAEPDEGYSCPPRCSHDWWSHRQFYTTNNGPGLHPTQGI